MTFFSQYFNYVGESESPILYHRWSAISLLGAMMGRQVYIPFGHSLIYPNQYIMLMGSPGTRKSSAINIARKLLAETGYTRFAPDRTSKERFLIDMKRHNDEELEAGLEYLVVDSPSEIYVVAEEFTDFVGQGGMEFMTMLTKLWDNGDTYKHPKIHGKCIEVDRPTVNIIGGNTVQGLSLALPPEALGNGFMSRIIFVYAEPTGIKITFPKPVSLSLRKELVLYLKEIKDNMKGEITISSEAYPVLDYMYKNFKDIDDPRFRHYSTRRFTHLLKLTSIIAISEMRTEVTPEDAINANTILYATEHRMPKSLGEFGKSRFSDVSNTIMEALTNTVKPLSINEVWKIVAKDLTKISELGDIMKNLIHAGKVQILTIGGKQGYMPLISETKTWNSSYLNLDYLQEGELV